MRIRDVAIVVCFAGFVGCHPAPQPSPKIGTVDRVTVPLILEGNRPFIDLTFARANGTVRSARFLVDTGATAFFMTEALAHDIDLQWGELAHEGDREVAPSTSPVQAFVGEFPLDLEAARPLVLLRTDDALEGDAKADGVLPGRLLCQYHVVLDYPAESATISRAGVIAPIGDRTAMPVSAALGLARTEVEADGKRIGFLIETGAPRSRISSSALGAWGGSDTLAFRWGAIELRELTLAPDSARTFEDVISPRMTKAVVGALGSDVLQRFRIDLDYPHEALYVSNPAR